MNREVLDLCYCAFHMGRGVSKRLLTKCFKFVKVLINVVALNFFKKTRFLPIYCSVLYREGGIMF